MMNIVLCAGFDPITQCEIQTAKELTKAGFEVYLMPFERGILPLENRRKLLKKAVKPYRRIHVYDQQVKCEIRLEISGWQESEQIVRNGELLKAASGVRAELTEEGYYLDQVVTANCKNSRAAHSVSVANVCVKLAKAHGVDQKEAYIAGMLHDVTKKWDDDRSRALLEIYDSDMLVYNSKVWHSFTCPVFLKRTMGIRNKHILNAIYHHTLGDGNSKLDKILYIADKIEPLRGYDSTREMMLALKNLNVAVSLIQEESKAYREEKKGK